ncbi:hypothetical protein LNV08_04560 [Paucibacter sp. TC2R-5]|uniref:hypothetical protein n=1 Tax=Paucibacter sp. TC2R-5 TaxID=2893555 RepID=UPI0021E415C7|nr:hypothetical protein [Paucibacter sp. TC2R-5]MCV2358240.1 hypothetical protein [Paucibacter sp. TC2R-5]
MNALATSKSFSLSAAVLAATLALTACGDGSDPVDPPAPAPTQINAANMVDVAALAGYERAQSQLVANGYRLLPLWFSTGQNGSASSNCSSTGSVNYSQTGSDFSLSASACKHAYVGKDYLLSSGTVSTAKVASAAGNDYDLSYKDWVSSLHNPLEGAALDTISLTGKVAERSTGTNMLSRTADYIASKNGQQISVTFVDNVENRQTPQGFGEVLVSATVTIKTAKFAQPLKISVYSDARADTITAADGSVLSVSELGNNVLLELRPTGAGTPSASRTVTPAELKAAMNKVF